MQMIFEAARDHVVTATVATANLVLAGVAGVVELLGAQVNDGLLVAGIMFVLTTGTGIAGWALVLLVRMTGEIARLQERSEEYERRLQSGGL